VAPHAVGHNEQIAPVTTVLRDLLKEVRTQLMETARPLMEAMVHQATGVKVLSLHHDISTVIGEEIVIFTLVKAPSFRETKKKLDPVGLCVA